ncbi:hypothetical protein [Streptomyces akebiae]|nr:hypothetical protein [Streptomyces akebiae]
MAVLPHERLTEAVDSVEELTVPQPGASGSLMVCGRCARCGGE